jgi:Asp/Glu/hydantoin racemase
MRSLAEQLPVPIATSALLQIPSILAFLPTSAVIGVLTYDSERLGLSHLQALSIDASRVRIYGMPVNGHLRDVIQNGATYDTFAMEKEMVGQAAKLIEQVRSEGKTLGAIVLECTQMPPFAEAIQRRTRVPVYDVFSLGQWFYSGLVKQTPSAWCKDSD